LRQLIQAECENVWQYPLGKSSRLSGEARLMFITPAAPLDLSRARRPRAGAGYPTLIALAIATSW